SLFNLNPLIKLDGYYLLSDWLDVPNLRQKAFRFLETFGAMPATSRERRIYISYGLLAWIYSTWLLGFVVLWFGKLLTSRYQAWGFVLFVVIVATFFHRPLGRLFARLAAIKKFATFLAGLTAVA